MVRIMTISTTSDRAQTAIRAALQAAGLVMLLVSPAGGEPVNPHWNKTSCPVCHTDAAPVAGRAALNTGAAEQLCEDCHGGSGQARQCRHFSDIPVGDMNMPEAYAENLVDGRLVCTTCHDLTVQCLSPSVSYSFMNPGFVRDRVSRSRGEDCFRCHETSGFEKLNPHVMNAGNPEQPTCTLCHASMPAKDEHGWLPVTFHLARSLNDLCTGCHAVKPHPGNSFSGEPIGWEHLALPSAEVRENMARSEQVLGLIFPLDPNTGEVHCSTCHNPHHDDLDGYPVAQDPGRKGRLRVDDICQACHDL
jgi:hypothetical protein